MDDNEAKRLQFELEQELRTRILNSPKGSRQDSIEAAYEELFDKFPEHSVFKPSEDERKRRGKLGAGMILPLSKPGDDILEIGCGRGDVLSALARHGRHCVGVEPSRHMIDMCRNSTDVEVVFGTADHLPFTDSAFDIIFSQEVLEHVHPADIPEYFLEVFRVLRPGGLCIVETPNRTTGPQDISRGFTRVAQRLHLKEWSVYGLIRQFRQAGFVRIKGLLSPQYLARRWATVHRLTHVHARVKHLQDIVLRIVPGLQLRSRIGKLMGLDDIFLFGRKPTH